MENKRILKNYEFIFNNEFAKRVIAAIIFVPAFIYSLHQGGFLIYFLFIFFYAIILFELINIFKKSHYKIIISLYIFFSSFSLIIFPFYFFTLDNNFLICIYILFSLWIFDTFSYVGGNLIKGKKIFPRLSKGKTYSGALTGYVVVNLFNLLITYSLYNQFNFNLFILALLICILSFIGDASVSFLKRQSNLKDTGSLFIGHGGFLDRMDSFIMVVFFFIISDLHILLHNA